MTGKICFNVSLILILALLTTGAALGQAPTQDNIQIFLEKIRADKKLLVAAVMELTETEGKAFWPIYDDYQKELQKINAAIGDQIVNFANNYKNMTDPAAEKLMNESLDIDAKRLQMKKEYIPKFEKAISKAKVLKYFQLENKIQLALNYELSTQIPMMR